MCDSGLWLLLILSNALIRSNYRDCYLLSYQFLRYYTHPPPRVEIAWFRTRANTGFYPGGGGEKSRPRKIFGKYLTKKKIGISPHPSTPLSDCILWCCNFNFYLPNFVWTFFLFVQFFSGNTCISLYCVQIRMYCMSNKSCPLPI